MRKELPSLNTCLTNLLEWGFSINKIFICLFILIAFSSSTFAAVYGKIEVQCPDKTFKVYVDDKLAGSGTVVAKVKPGNHKIKVLEKGKMVLKKTVKVAVNQYLVIKGAPPSVTMVVPVIPEAMPEYLASPAPTPETISIVTPQVSPEAAAPAPPPKTEETAPAKEEPLSFHYYLQPGLKFQDSYSNGSMSLAAGWEFPLDRSFKLECCVSTFNGENIKEVISEGTIGVNGVDVGMVYMLGDFYAGTGVGYYMFSHTVADSVLKEKKALHFDYDEKVDDNAGFYCKGGYRFSLMGLKFDLGIKSIIINTVARAYERDTVFLVEREDSLNYGFPITTAYLGIVF